MYMTSVRISIEAHRYDRHKIVQSKLKHCVYIYLDDPLEDIIYFGIGMMLVRALHEKRQIQDPSKPFKS